MYRDYFLIEDIKELGAPLLFSWPDCYIIFSLLYIAAHSYNPPFSFLLSSGIWSEPVPHHPAVADEFHCSCQEQYNGGTSSNSLVIELAPSCLGPAY